MDNIKNINELTEEIEKKTIWSTDEEHIFVETKIVANTVDVGVLIVERDMLEASIKAYTDEEYIEMGKAVVEMETESVIEDINRLNALIEKYNGN